MDNQAVEKEALCKMGQYWNHWGRKVPRLVEVE